MPPRQMRAAAAIKTVKTLRDLRVQLEQSSFGR